LQFADRAQAMGAGALPSLHLIKACAMVPLKLYQDASGELQAFLANVPEGQNALYARNLLAQVQAQTAAAAPPSTVMGFAPAH
jgi:hypothetical protein